MGPLVPAQQPIIQWFHCSAASRRSESSPRRGGSHLRLKVLGLWEERAPRRGSRQRQDSGGNWLQRLDD